MCVCVTDIIAAKLKRQPPAKALLFLRTERRKRSILDDDEDFVPGVSNSGFLIVISKSSSLLPRGVYRGVCATGVHFGQGSPLTYVSYRYMVHLMP